MMSKLYVDTELEHSTFGGLLRLLHRSAAKRLLAADAGLLSEVCKGQTFFVII